MVEHRSAVRETIDCGENMLKKERRETISIANVKELTGVNESKKIGQCRRFIHSYSSFARGGA